VAAFGGVRQGGVPRIPPARFAASLVVDDAVVDDSVRTVLRSYLDPRDAWRRIDQRALDSLPTLALQMDNYIHNTSLALAFEFQDTEKDVLLFPGDAQVGNWDCA
jgi:hypothetical protein